MGNGGADALGEGALGEEIHHHDPAGQFQLGQELLDEPLCLLDVVQRPDRSGARASSARRPQRSSRLRASRASSDRPCPVQ